MALSRGRGRNEFNIWPGFVDAMTSLLMVMMFVLSIFMIVQFVLQDTVSEKDSELADLGGQVASSISQRVTDVVVGAKAGSKKNKAEEMGLSLLSESAFLALIASTGTGPTDAT